MELLGRLVLEADIFEDRVVVVILRWSGVL
jgi:hypothetical protein